MRLSVINYYCIVISERYKSPSIQREAFHGARLQLTLPLQRSG